MGGLGGTSEDVGAGADVEEYDGEDSTGLLGLLLKLLRLDAVGREAEAGYLVLGMSGGGRLNAGSAVAAGRRDAKLGPPSIVLPVRGSGNHDDGSSRYTTVVVRLRILPAKPRSSSRTVDWKFGMRRLGGVCQ